MPPKTTTPFPNRIQKPKNILELSDIGRTKSLSDIGAKIREAADEILVGKQTSASSTAAAEPSLFNKLEGAVDELGRLDVKDTNYESVRKAAIEKVTSIRKTIVPHLQLIVNLLNELMSHPTIYDKPEKQIIKKLIDDIIGSARGFISDSNKDNFNKLATSANAAVTEALKITDSQELRESETFNNEIQKAIENLIVDAERDVAQEWGKVKTPDLTNIQEGKKRELIRYLKTIYFGDANFGVQFSRLTPTKNKRLRNYLEKNPQDRSVIKIIADLEDETNPIRFSEKATKLDINAIAENAIGRYLKNQEWLEDEIKNFTKIRDDYADEINAANIEDAANSRIENPARKKAMKKFKDERAAHRDKWIEEALMMMLNGRHLQEATKKAELDRLGRKYDEIFELNNVGSFANQNPNFEELRDLFSTNILTANLLGVNPHDVLTRIDLTTYSPPLDLVTEAAMRRKFEEFGQEIETKRYMPSWTENWRHKNCRDSEGNKVDFATLVKRGQISVREGPGNEVRFLFSGNSVVPTHILTNTFDGVKQKIVLMNHDKNGDIYTTVTIRNEIQTKKDKTEERISVSRLEEASYKLGVEMRLDNLSDKYSIRIGLIEKQKPALNDDQSPKLDNGGNPIMEDYLELAILTNPALQNPYSKKDSNLIKDIKKRYGTRIFEDPEGNRITVEELLDANRIEHRPLFNVRTKDETQTLSQRKREQKIQNAGTNLVKGGKAVVGGIATAGRWTGGNIGSGAVYAGTKIVQGAKAGVDVPGRVRDAYVARQKKQAAEEGLREINAYTGYREALDNLVPRFNLDDDQNNGRWTRFEQAMEDRQDRNQPHQFVGQNFQPKMDNQELFNEEGELDLLGIYIVFRKELQKFYNTPASVDPALKEQITAKIAAIGKFLEDNRGFFDRSENLRQNIVLDEIRTRYMANGVNRPLDLWFHDIVKGTGNIHQLVVVGDNRKFTKQIIQYRQEMSLIGKILEHPEQHKVGNNLQSYLDKELKKEYIRLEKEYNQHHKQRGGR